eukprot:4509887-Pleurochrysis_carterae.AAC.2
MREVAEHARVWPCRQGGYNVRDIERRRGTRGEVEGHDDWAAQVPNAPACCLHKQACPRMKGCGRGCAVVSRVAHGSQIMEQRHPAGCSLGGGRGSVSGGAIRGVKGWSASASRMLLPCPPRSVDRSEEGTVRAARRHALARSHRKGASAMELSGERERAKAGFRRG